MSLLDYSVYRYLESYMNKKFSFFVIKYSYLIVVKFSWRYNVFLRSNCYYIV